MRRQNISAAQYREEIKKFYDAVLEELSTFHEREQLHPEIPMRSFVGAELCCRDDEDAYWVIGECDRIFKSYDPEFKEYMKDEYEFLTVNDSESINKFYWEVTLYTEVDRQIIPLYHVDFSLVGEVMDVYAFAKPAFEKWYYENEKKYSYLLASLQYIYEKYEQVNDASHVILPYKPGDILYVDANPFGKPFYAVFCGDTFIDMDHFEWIFKEYGYHRREHPCLYYSDEKKRIIFTDLTCRSCNGYGIRFRLCLLDRIRAIQFCDNQILQRMSNLIKENPDIVLKKDGFIRRLLCDKRDL